MFFSMRVDKHIMVYQMEHNSAIENNAVDEKS